MSSGEATDNAPRVTMAREGLLVSQGTDSLDLHLTNGSTHETDPTNPDHYQISTFEQTDIPIELPSSDNKAAEPVPVGVMSTWALPRQAGRVDPVSARWYLIEFHRRLALPTASAT